MIDNRVDDDIDGILGAMKQEHEDLVRLVGRIKLAIDKKNVDDATELLVELQLYQQAHFQHEIDLMERYDYPDTAMHEAAHLALIESLNSIYRIIKLENLRRLNGELGTYLEDSLSHIMEVDRPLQEFLLARKSIDA